MTRRAPRPASAVGPSRREILIDSAARQLNRDGVRDTMLHDLAAELSLSRAALYYYIDDREDLVFQVYRRSCELLARALGQAVSEERGALDVVRGFASRILAPGQPQIAAMTELGLLREDDRATVLALFEGVVARLGDVLDAGMKRGEIRPLESDIVARTLISMIHSVPQIFNFPTALGAEGEGDFIALLKTVMAHGWASDRQRVIRPLAIDLDPLRAARVSAFDRQGLAASKREQILIAASDLFNRKGVDATSMDDIAAVLRATKRTLYQHVGDKRALVTACLERSYAIMAAIQAQGEAHRAAGAEALDVMIAILRASAETWLCDDIIPMRVGRGFDAHDPADKGRLADYIEGLGTTFLGYAERMREQGEIRPEIDVVTLLPVLPTVAAWLSKGLMQVPAPRRPLVAAEVVDVHRLGLAPL